MTMHKYLLTRVLVAGSLTLAFGAWAADPAAPAPTTNRNVLVLHRAGAWRAFYTWALPQVKTADGIKPRILKYAREVIASDMAGFNFMTTYPPAGWMETGFDDTVWTRRHFLASYSNGETDYRAGGGTPSYYTRQISLRGKFNVTDPAKIGTLALNLGFRGGVVIYVNGREIKRAFLPAGTLEPGALAEAYPDSVIVDADGKPIPWYPDRRKLDEITPLRVRRIERLAIPAELLHKGCNVLAVEIHTTPYHESSLDYRVGIHWVPCGLVDLSLEADSADGLVPNVARPAGTQVWNANLIEHVTDVDWGDPLEPLAPIRMVAARNGVFSGKIVVSADRPIEGVRATATDLSGGGKTIPASAIRVSYGSLDTAGANTRRLEGMLDAPPKTVPVSNAALPAPLVRGAVETVHITVRVGRDTAPGLYKGTLHVMDAGGLAVQAPVEVNVVDWVLPDPAAFTYWCGMVELAEGPAGVYGTPLWSDKHMQMVGKSFDLMAQLGTRVLFVPLAAEMELGNAEGMARFTKGADGKFSADLSAVEKYLDTALKHLGKPRYVICGVWQRTEQLQPTEQGAPMISVVDAAGLVENVRGPKHGTPESIELWKPVLTKIDAMLTARGLKGTLVLGMGDDIMPNVETATAFKQILPEAGWYDGAHVSNFSTVRVADGTVPIIYQCNVYGVGEVPDPAVTRHYGWNRKYVIPGGQQVWLQREVYDHASLSTFRAMPESMPMSDRPGQGCLGADFWPPPVPAGARRMSTLFSRFPRTANVGAGGKGITATQLLYPGPDGAVPTLRFEVMREGIQETEARIALERLLLEKPCRLPEELARKAQELLDDRARRARVWMNGDLLPYSGWEGRSQGLFEMAAAAAQVVGNVK